MKMSRVFFVLFIATGCGRPPESLTCLEIKGPTLSASAVCTNSQADGHWLAGDILLAQVEQSPENPVRGAVVSSPSKRFLLWSKGRVAYEFAHDVSYAQRDVFARAMLELKEKSRGLVQFVERKNEPDFVSIQNGSVCGSRIGRVGGEQPLMVAPEGCGFSVALHELMHVLGFIHEMQRPDRDQHIVLHPENVSSGFEDQLTIWEGAQVLTPYDPLSIMHYDRYAFSRNNKPIFDLVDGGEFRRSNTLSSADVKAMGDLYSGRLLVTQNSQGEDTGLALDTTCVPGGFMGGPIPIALPPICITLANPTPIPSAPTPAPERSSAQEIRNAYQKFLGRSPTESEVQGWLGRSNAVYFIQTSDEALRKGIRDIYAEFAGRIPGPSEIEIWFPLAKARLNLDPVRSEIGRICRENRAKGGQC